jgi:nucleotide-binding universal stress UspA family protein
MPYRTLLVHLDDTESCLKGLAAAAGLARTFDAELCGSYLVPTRELTPFKSALLPEALVAQLLRRSGEAQDAAEARFKRAVASAGLAAHAWSAPAGDPIAAGIRQSRYADLTIFTQPNPNEAASAFVVDLAHSVLLASGRPLLLVPFIGARASMGERIVVAWKNTREAARAVADAMPLLTRAKVVEVLAIVPAHLPSEPPSDEIVAFLARHGIAAKLRVEIADEISAGELLLSHVSDISADLVVMGGYSHSRVQERVLGGVTRVMMTSMTVPVLMSH